LLLLDKSSVDMHRGITMRMRHRKSEGMSIPSASSRARGAIVMIQLAPVRSLIGSKLHAPRLNAFHVPRPRLTNNLQRHADRPLTLICAPAGSGKSTLLSEWLASTRVPSAWVSLDEHDNDLVLFTSYLLAAVQSIVPTLPLATRDLLQALTPPPLATLAVSLSNDLDQIDTKFLLVLDDYHAITNPEIDALVCQLLQYPSRTMHLAVATRTDPAWPLAAFRARGQMTELRLADLQFTPVESAAFLRQALDDALDQDLVTVLHEESEGWAAGLQLMSLVLAGAAADQGDILRELGDAKDLSAYLLEEVFARQPPGVQDHLLRLSLLERFNGSLCEAICDDDTETEDEPARWGEAFLLHLERSNLFVSVLDVRHEFYRFHHLFQRFLRARLLERSDPDQLAALHRRASAWFATQGLIEEALDHALAAGDVAEAANIVVQHRHDLYNHEQFARLTRWLRLLPTAVKEHNPELLLAEARIATMNWRFTEAAVLIDHAEKALADDPPDDGRTAIAFGELAVLRGILDLWSGNAEQLIAGLQHALEVLPLNASHLRGLAHMGIAAGTWQQGDPAKAKAYLDALLADTSATLPLFTMLLQARCFLYWIDGDLVNLAQGAERLLSVSQELALPDQVALAHHFLGTTHYARNNLEAAEQHLSCAIAARFNMRLLWWSEAAGVLALTYQARGQPDLARQTLNDAHEVLLERHALRLLPNIGAYQAELDRRQGRLAEAIAWTAHVEPGPLAWTLVMIDPRLAQVRVFLAEERSTGLEHAAALLAEVRAFCRRVPNPRLLLEVEALAALLEDQQGQREAALETLTRVVLAAQPNVWVRLFVDLGEPMAALLRQLGARGVASHTIARLLSAFPDSLYLSVPSDQPGLIEPLTERELEVLGWLAARASNKEIAEHLFIAPSTVKRHTLNIYRKLEVNDRRGAVLRATQLGLLLAG
jgi:LuxR family transcriptional regulator, maltose regulon positive regulatory protein